MMVCAVLERDQMEGRQAHQPVFIIALGVEDVMAWLMSEHFPVSIFYECKKTTPNKKPDSKACDL